MQQGELNILKAAASQRKAALAEVCEWTMAGVIKMRSEGDSASARHQKLFLSIRRIVKARDKRNFKAGDTIVKLRKVY